MKVASHAVMDGRQQNDFDTRIASINALLAAYRNIATESADTGQLAQVESQVVLQTQRAKKKYQSGNYNDGRELLLNAYALVKNAIIQLRDGDTLTKSRADDEQYEIRKTAPSHLREAERLVHSIDTLMQAHQRVSQEKNQQDQAIVLQQNVAAIRVRSDRLYAAGEYAESARLLQGAYTLVKLALAALREGETLVQSLNFANKQEEYQYYLRKTHSQETAIDIMLTVSGESSRAALLQNLLQSSRRILDQAEGLAAQQEYSAAVALMEKALARLQSGLMMSLSSP